MRHYELLLIFKPTLTEEELKNKIDFTNKLIEENGGEIASILEMGTRKLAYEVKKFERGTYYVYYFKAPAASIKEIERVIRINEEIIKFMTIKFENKKEIASWEKLVSASNKKDEVETKSEKQEKSKEEEPKEETPKAESAAEQKEEE